MTQAARTIQSNQTHAPQSAEHDQIEYNDETRLFRQLIRANNAHRSNLPVNLNPDTLRRDPIYAEHIARQLLGHLNPHVRGIKIKTLNIDDPMRFLEAHWVGAVNDMPSSTLHCAVCMLSHLERQFGIKPQSLV